MDIISFEEPKEEIRDRAPEESDDSFNDNDSSNQQPPEDVVAYNELRSCADLVKMYRKNRLQTDVDFQRDFVWNNPMQTRFIDSLIKEIPIPSMCMALNHRTGERIVIDGKQRMLTIRRFLKQVGEPWLLSRLPDINEHISGKTTEQIKKEKPEYFDSVEELTLPVTVLRCDISKSDHMNYIFAIFHRLNKSGEKLNNQEIRNCIYGGPLNELLRSLDEMEEWRKLNLMKPGNKYRFVKQELVLRFFAFFYEGTKYKGRMAEFLNDFMRKYQEDNEISL